MQRLKKLLKWLLVAVAALVALIVILSGLGLGYRTYRQSENAKSLIIRTPRAVVAQQFVRIGGMDEWIQFRGEDRDNPVILFLHGGPGYSAIPFTYETMRPWERYFTIVHWDQRGAGRTFIHNKRMRLKDNSIERMVADSIEVAELVRRALHKDKLILVGHSWGSILGAELIRRRPDLFYAYVGTGQVVNVPANEAASYAGLLARVQAASDRSSEAELRRIGAPPYRSPLQLSRERDVLSDYPAPTEHDWNRRELFYLLFAPGYGLRDDYDVKNTQDLGGNLFHQVFTYDILAHGNGFKLPVFFFQGADDLTTPPQLLVSLLPKITAPHKEVVLFQGGGHNSVNICREFLRELVRRVRPLAMGQRAIPGESVTRTTCTR